LPMAYDAVLTSGDVTRGLISQWKHLKIFHIGPERDLPLFADLVPEFASEDEAEVVVCTGLFDDETETPADYADRFAAFKSRNAAMQSANPDLKVERGDRIIPCAGAMAAAYEEIGGDVVYAGKPHGPIYEIARDLIKRGRSDEVADSDIVCIGDGVLTDIKGAADAGLDSVYIASAIHLAPGAFTEAAVAEMFAGSKRPPIAALKALA
ncbi:MAG: HAD hydrolase-like protein, partial [Pseudomonadota bacterium]